MTLTHAARVDAAQRLIRAVTGDDHGDGLIVSDMGVGTLYDSEEVWVAGNWNDKQRYENSEWITLSDMPSRLGNALERIGVEIYWYDEVSTCCECYRLVRTSPDSYRWTAEFISTDNGIVNGIVCVDCVNKYPEDYIEDMYVNNPDNAITCISESTLADLGWTIYTGDSDDGIYESGLHTHMTDNPHKVLEHIQETMPNHDVVFVISDTGQFHVAYTAWTKQQESE